MVKGHPPASVGESMVAREAAGTVGVDADAFAVVGGVGHVGVGKFLVCNGCVGVAGHLVELLDVVLVVSFGG